MFRVDFQTIDSTNNAAKEMLRSGTIPGLPLLLVAREQSGGRGKRERRWWTGTESLAFTLVIELDRQNRDGLPTLALRIGTLVARAIRPLLGRSHEITVKPPNDVCVDGKKICGILIESPTPQFAVIGIGINTNNTLITAPEEIRALPITTLLDLRGEPVDNERLLDEIVRTVADLF